MSFCQKLANNNYFAKVVEVSVEPGAAPRVFCTSRLQPREKLDRLAVHVAALEGLDFRSGDRHQRGPRRLS